MYSQQQIADNIRAIFDISLVTISIVILTIKLSQQLKLFAIQNNMLITRS